MDDATCFNSSDFEEFVANHSVKHINILSSNEWSVKQKEWYSPLKDCTIQELLEKDNLVWLMAYSIFMDAKAILVEQQWYYLTHSWKDKGKR